MDKVKVELINYKKDGTQMVYDYSVEHNNGQTSLEQTLSIKSVPGLFVDSWVASVEMGDFPSQNSPLEAALKLTDWLERLSIAIKNGTYAPPPKEKYIEPEKISDSDDFDLEVELFFDNRDRAPWREVQIVQDLKHAKLLIDNHEKDNNSAGYVLSKVIRSEFEIEDFETQTKEDL